jgi:hypothetical protein
MLRKILATLAMTVIAAGGVATITEASASASPTSQAVGTAYDYLDYMPFSKAGLADQLVYEGYSRSVANYAVNHVHTNWYSQAVKSAKSYLSFMHFSCSGLIGQLKYEKYTSAQASYGAHHTRAC